MKSLVVKIILMMLVFLMTAPVFGKELISNVGIRLISTEFPATDSEIKAVLWYPTLVAPKRTMMGPFELNVAKDSKIQKGSYALIVISHGSQGSHMGHRDTAFYLAKRNYFVISILHPRNNFLDDSDGRTTANWINRPLHISTMLDYVLNDNSYKNYIDRERIGVIGFSAGGYTALSLVGGVPDAAAISSHCIENKKNDPIFCGGPDLLYRAANLFSSQTILENTADPRVKAAVLLAPVGVLFKDQQSLSEVNVPLRIYRGGKDKVLQYPHHAESIRQKLVEKPQFVSVKNAGHYSFMAPIQENMKDKIGPIGKDPQGFNRQKFHAVMNREIVQFMSESLNDL